MVPSKFQCIYGEKYFSSKLQTCKKFLNFIKNSKCKNTCKNLTVQNEVKFVKLAMICKLRLTIIKSGNVKYI